MVAILQPVSSGKLIAIDRAVILVGRGSDCDAIIQSSQKISRRHCCLVQVDEFYFVRDLGSMNGVWVNNDRVTREARLSAGDRVCIGDVEYLFHPNVRIEQKKTVSEPESEPEPARPVTADLEAPAKESADLPGLSTDEEDDLLGLGNIKLKERETLDGDRPSFEDDVIPLDTSSQQTNEIKINDQPIVDDHDSHYDQDDEDLLILDD